MPTPLLGRLLGRSDRVAITQGRLSITPATGRPVPSIWLEQHGAALIAEAAHKGNVMALQYVDYSTGSYIVDKTIQRRADGVTLQFCCMASGTMLCAIFNASLRRERNTKHGKKGTPLPANHFRVGKRSNFYRFWQSTGLPMNRTSDFHDYMGNLRGLIYTASIKDGERLDTSTLRPLTLILPDKAPTTPRHAPDNAPTRFPYKQTQQMQSARSTQPFPTTGPRNHGNTVIRECGYTGSPTPPELQTNDEWLSDYDRATNDGVFGAPKKHGAG